MLSTWEAAYRIVGWKAYIFPAPSQIVDAGLSQLNIDTHFGDPIHRGWPRRSVREDAADDRESILTSPLIIANAVSALRLLVGFAISILLGAALGLAMWRWVEIDRLLGPVFLGMQTLPSVCWVPLGMLLFGLNEIGILFVLVMGSCFAISIALRDGLRTIPPVYQRAGLMLGARGWRLYRYVLLPASLPALASSLRQGFSFAWRSLMGAELILEGVKHKGLGFLLDSGRANLNIALVVAIMAMMVLLGMLADRFGFAILEKRVHARFGLTAAR